MTTLLRVVFDLDDTLYPEREFAYSGFRAAGAWASANWGFGDGVAAQMGQWLDAGHLGKVFRMALAEHRPGYSDADLEAFIDAYRRHQPELTLYKDAGTALDHCAGLGPLGLITDGTHYVQENKVRALGIANRFARIIYTNALGGRAFHKPHPRSFELMEAELAAPGAHFVYVGDNPAKDFIVPNQRGWSSVQVLRPQGLHDTKPAVGAGAAAYVIESLYELASVLEGLA